MKKYLVIPIFAFSSIAYGQSLPGQDPTTGQDVARQSIIAEPVTSSPVVAVPVNQSGIRALPVSTILQVTPSAQIRSNRIEEGDIFQFTVVQDVIENGYMVIPRGSIVQGTITWKTGRAVGGKSGKFDITWNFVTVGGQQFRLQGVHRQEGRGNTLGALLGSLVISGRSAQLDPGNIVTALTAEPIPYVAGS